MTEIAISVDYMEMTGGKTFVSIMLDGKNISTTFGLYEFANELELIGYNAKFKNINSKTGFILEEIKDKSKFESIVKRYARQYEIR